MDRWKTPLLHKFHNLNVKQVRIFLCFTENDHYIQNYRELFWGAEAPRPPGSDGPGILWCAPCGEYDL